MTESHVFKFWKNLDAYIYIFFYMYSFVIVLGFVTIISKLSLKMQWQVFYYDQILSFNYHCSWQTWASALTQNQLTKR